MIYTEAFKNEVIQTPFTNISKETNKAIIEAMENEHPAAQLAFLVFLTENILSVWRKNTSHKPTLLQNALGYEGFRNPLNNYFTPQAILQKLGDPARFKTFRERLFKEVPPLKKAFMPDLQVYSDISQKAYVYLKKREVLPDNFFMMFNGSNAVIRNANNDKVLERVSVFCDVLNRLVAAKYGQVLESTKTSQTHEDFKRLTSLEHRFLKTLYQEITEGTKKLSQDLLEERGFSLTEIEETMRSLVSQNFVLRKERSSYGSITFPENVAQHLHDLTMSSAVATNLRNLKSPSESKYEGKGNLLDINGKKISDQSVFWEYLQQTETSENKPTEEEDEELLLNDVVEKMIQEIPEEETFEIEELENLWLSGEDNSVEYIASTPSESSFNDRDFNWYEPSPELEEKSLENLSSEEELPVDKKLENAALFVARLKTLGIASSVCPETFVVTVHK